MKLLLTAILTMAPVVQSVAADKPDLSTTSVAGPALQLDLRSAISGADPGWVDEGTVQWMSVPVSTQAWKGCVRLPLITAPHLAIDSKGAIYFDGLEGQKLWRLQQNGRLQSRQFQPPAVVLALALSSVDELWIGDDNEHVIERLNDDGTLALVAGQRGQPGHINGAGEHARFSSIGDIASDDNGDLVVVDSDTVRRVKANGETSLIAGGHPSKIGVSSPRRRARGGVSDAAVFAGIGGMAVSVTGDIYVADVSDGYNALRKIDRAGAVTKVLDDAGSHGAFHAISSIAVDLDGGLLVVDQKPNKVGSVSRPRLLKVDLNGRVTTRFEQKVLAGRYDPKVSEIYGLVGLTVDRQGRVFAADYIGTTIHRIDPNGAAFTPCFTPGAVTVDRP